MKIRKLWRHVILVVLGQHLLSLKGATCVELAPHQDALTLTKQVRQYAAVDHRKLRALMVGEHELHIQPGTGALDAVFQHHATRANLAAHRGRTGRNLLRRIEQIQIFVERVEHHAHRQRGTNEDEANGQQAIAATWIHGASPAPWRAGSKPSHRPNRVPAGSSLTPSP